MRLGPVGWARWAWRQLTSMRTALFLLLLLSVAAVPGSIFPQRAVDAGQVADFVAANPDASVWLDRFSMFDVYTSPWFSAIYLLLVVSLLGCIVPRSRLHWHAVRARPPRAPSRLDRLAQHESYVVSATPEQVLAAARRELGRRRFRVHSHDAGSVSAESGYLRETGNLVFHTSICVVVVGVAFGYLFGWRGDVIVPVGSTFSSTASAYDTFAPGPMVDVESLPPFRLTVTDMDVAFEQTPGPQLGVPRRFAASVSVAEGDAEPVQAVIGPNEPLTVAGADVFLLGNGYAPVISVRDTQGNLLYREATPFLAQDNTYRSTGAVKVRALPEPRQLGFNGVFLPTAEPSYVNGPVSIFPDLGAPELVMSVWEGTLFPGGRPQSVYTLSTQEMTPVNDLNGAPLVIRLQPGQTVTLPGDRGTVTLEDVKRFAGLSVRVDPGKGLTLAAALAAMLGLVASLLIRRRRVFVRVSPAASVDGGLESANLVAPRTVVSIGALARSNDPTLGAFVRDLGTDLTSPLGVVEPTLTDKRMPE